ncbi:MAG: hypothetical protein Kow006_04080 [Gammaproteobacteria bacterium]
MLRKRIGGWVESSRIQHMILALIAVNAVTLGLETSPAIMAEHGTLLRWLDHIILSIFVVEIGLKLVAFGWRFFREPWNVFDFLVVGIALVPASGPLAVLRTLRVLRILRLVSMVPRMRLVVESLLHAVPGIASIAGLMLILFYVAAVMATGFFSVDYPQWFGTIARSMYSLFQIMTLESWSMGIVRPVMEQYPYAWLFFVPFILLATFTMLNLFIAIIVNTMQEMHERQNREEQEEIAATVHDDTHLVLAEISALRAELAELRSSLAAERE